MRRRIWRSRLPPGRKVGVAFAGNCPLWTYVLAETEEVNTKVKTTDGTKAISVVERLQRVEFRDPRDWHLLGSVGIPWPGADHLDFSADGSYLMISTEWSGIVAR